MCAVQTRQTGAPRTERTKSRQSPCHSPPRRSRSPSVGSRAAEL